MGQVHATLIETNPGSFSLTRTLFGLAMFITVPKGNARQRPIQFKLSLYTVKRMETPNPEENYET